MHGVQNHILHICAWQLESSFVGWGMQKVLHHFQIYKEKIRSLQNMKIGWVKSLLWVSRKKKKSLFLVKLNLKCVSRGMLSKIHLFALDNKLPESLLSIKNFVLTHIPSSFSKLLSGPEAVTRVYNPYAVLLALLSTLCLGYYYYFFYQFVSPEGYPSAPRKYVPEWPYQKAVYTLKR